MFLLEIPEGTKQVCTTCFGRINKRIGQLEEAGMESRPETEDVSWTDAEVELLKIGLRSHGNNWDKIGPSLPEKTPDQCKKYFYRMRKKLQLDKIVMEYKKVSHISSSVSLSPHLFPPLYVLITFSCFRMSKELYLDKILMD